MPNTSTVGDSWITQVQRNVVVVTNIETQTLKLYVAHCQDVLLKNFSLSLSLFPVIPQILNAPVHTFNLQLFI